MNRYTIHTEYEEHRVYDNRLGGYVAIFMNLEDAQEWVDSKNVQPWYAIHQAGDLIEKLGKHANAYDAAVILAASTHDPNEWTIFSQETLKMYTEEGDE